MQIRVCPICDQKMDSAHYCKKCRRFVRQPYIRTVNYYLNEQPPRTEAEQKFEESGQTRQRTPVNGQKPVFGKAQWQPAKAPARSNRNSSAALIGFIILVIAVGAAVLKIGSEFRYEQEIRTTVINEETEFSAEGFDPGDFHLDEWVEDFEGLTAEEVIEAGVACNTYGHFQMTGEEMEAMLLQLIEDGEYQESSRSEYSFNERYENGDTCFSSVVIYYLEKETEDSYPLISIDYDTATGQLHEVALSMENPDKAVETAAVILEFLAEKEGFANDGADVEQAVTGLAEAFEWEEDFSYQVGPAEIYGYVFDEDYSVYISCER